MSKALLDYTQLVTSQHRDKRRFIDTLTATLQPLTELQANLEHMPIDFDVDEAQGPQLDAVGARVGISRFVKEPLPNLWFSFGVLNKGFGQGRWRDVYSSGSLMDRLDDESFRRLIYAKIEANRWDGTVPGLQAILSEVIPPTTGCYILVEDEQTMRVVIGISGQWPPIFDVELLEQKIIPYSIGGVETQVLMVSEPAQALFGFGVNNQYIGGFGIGRWGADPSFIVENYADQFPLLTTLAGHEAQDAAAIQLTKSNEFIFPLAASESQDAAHLNAVIMNKIFGTVAAVGTPDIAAINITQVNPLLLPIALTETADAAHISLIPNTNVAIAATETADSALLLTYVGLNPLDKDTQAVLSPDFLTITTTSSTYSSARTTLGRSDTTGKFFYSGILNAFGSSNAVFGFGRSTVPLNTFIAAETNAVSFSSNGYFYADGVGSTGWKSIVTGERAGFEFDADLLRLFVYRLKGGVWHFHGVSQVASSLSTKPIFPIVTAGDTTVSVTADFGDARMALPNQLSHSWDGQKSPGALNPSDRYSSDLALSNGNLSVTYSGTDGTVQNIRATYGVIPLDTNGFYFEVTVGQATFGGGVGSGIGVIGTSHPLGAFPGVYSGGVGWVCNGLIQSASFNANIGVTYTAGDVIGVHITSTETLFYKNGKFIINLTTPSGFGALYATASLSHTSDNFTFNFGATPFDYKPYVAAAYDNTRRYVVLDIGTRTGGIALAWMETFGSMAWNWNGSGNQKVRTSFPAEIGSYCEIMYLGRGTGTVTAVGITNASWDLQGNAGENQNSVGYYTTGKVSGGLSGGTPGSHTVSATYGVGDIIGIWILTSGVRFFKNGTFQEEWPFKPAGNTYVFVTCDTRDDRVTTNFGLKDFAYIPDGAIPYAGMKRAQAITWDIQKCSQYVNVRYQPDYGLIAFMSGNVTDQSVLSTAPMPVGTYCEIIFDTLYTGNTSYACVGLANASHNVETRLGVGSNSIGYNRNGSRVGGTGSGGGTTWVAGDVMGIERPDASTAKIYKNGTLVATHTTMPSGPLYVAASLGNQNDLVRVNFGASPLLYMPAARSVDLTRFAPTIADTAAITDRYWSFSPDRLTAKRSSPGGYATVIGTTARGFGHYFEAKVVNPDAWAQWIGIANEFHTFDMAHWLGYSSNASMGLCGNGGWYGPGGFNYSDGFWAPNSSSGYFVNGDVLGCELTGQTARFYLNGVFIYESLTLPTVGMTYFPGISMSGTQSMELNFGEKPFFFQPPNTVAWNNPSEPAPAQWSTTDKEANLALSNSNLTVEKVTTTGSLYSIARGAWRRAFDISSKHFFQTTVDVIASGGRFRVGFGNNAASLGGGSANYIGFDTNGVAYGSTGNFSYGGVFGSPEAIVQGDIVGCEWDAERKRASFYKFNTADSKWRLIGSVNNVTGVGYAMYPMVLTLVVGDKSTTNFGASAFAAPLRPGVFSWDARQGIGFPSFWDWTQRGDNIALTDAKYNRIAYYPTFYTFDNNFHSIRSTNPVYRSGGYIEFRLEATIYPGNSVPEWFGLVNSSAPRMGTGGTAGGAIGADGTTGIAISSDGLVQGAGITGQIDTGYSLTMGDVVGIQYNGTTASFYKNGTLVYTATTLPTGSLYAAVSLRGQSDTIRGWFGHEAQSFPPAVATNWDGGPIETLVSFDPTDTSDQSTGNYLTFSNNNLTLTNAAGRSAPARATASRRSGHYFEVTISSIADSYGETSIGVSTTIQSMNNNLGYSQATIAISHRGGLIGLLNVNGTTTFANGDVIGVLSEANSFRFYKNGTLIAKSHTIVLPPTTTTPDRVPFGAWFPSVGVGNTGEYVSANFGNSAFSYQPAGSTSWNDPNPPTTTLNPSDKSTDVTLTGNNLVATSTTATNAWVRGTRAIDECFGSYFFTVTWTSDAGSGKVGIGLGTTAYSLSASGSNTDGFAFFNTQNSSWVVGTKCGLQWIPSRRQVNVWILVGGTTWNYVGVLNGLIPGPWGTPLFPMVYVQNASATVDFAPTFLPPGSQTWNGVTQANILPPPNIIPDAYDKAANAVLSLHNTSFLMSSGSGGVRGSHYIQYGYGARYFFTGTVATAPTSGVLAIGLATDSAALDGSVRAGGDTNSCAYYSDGKFSWNNSDTATGTTWASAGDQVGVEWSPSEGACRVYKRISNAWSLINTITGMSIGALVYPFMYSTGDGQLTMNCGNFPMSTPPVTGGLQDYMWNQMPWRLGSYGRSQTAGNKIAFSSTDRGTNVGLGGFDTVVSNFAGATSGSARGNKAIVGSFRQFCYLRVENFSGSPGMGLGIANASASVEGVPANDANSAILYSDGNLKYNGTTTTVGTAWQQWDIIGMDWNPSNSTLTFYKWGVLGWTTLGSLGSISISPVYPFAWVANGNSFPVDFGQNYWRRLPNPSGCVSWDQTQGPL
jgi:hypothetical protein